MSNKNEDFVPGGHSSVFKCKFCGKGGMVWKEVLSDVWRPYDMEKNKVHSCTVREDEEYLEYQNQNTGVITLESLVENLELLGFEYFIPRTVSWKFALIKSNTIQTVYFLIGRLGIDFKLYDHVRDTNTDDNGKLYTDGGLAVRNYYWGSEINVHHLILKIANQLANNIPIDNALLTGQGRSINKQRSDEKIKKELVQKNIEKEQYLYDKSHVINKIVLDDKDWMHEIWEWAEEFRIPETIVPKSRTALLELKELNISKYDVTYLPAGIGNLNSLEEFDDWGGKLTSLPESIGNLKSLKILYIVGSVINLLPDSIGNLSSLLELEITNSNLVSLPESIGNLSNLELLDISSNRLAWLPESIGNLSNLKTFNAGNNRLDSLPSSIEDLSQLEALFIEGNVFSSLPESIGNISNLKTLNASSNQLTELSNSMKNLRNFKSLDITSNNIISLSKTVGGVISNLEILRIDDRNFEVWARSIDFSGVNLEVIQTRTICQNFVSTFNYLTGIDKP